MTRRISFLGPAAPGLADGRTPSVGDLLDLQDERIYRTRWPDDPYEDQYAGILALISCCGAWVDEVALLETTDIEVKNVPKRANVDPKNPADNGIWLGRGDFRRRVWVPEVVRMTLARVTGRIPPAAGCTRLFMRRDGTPMTRQEITDKVGSLCERIGIGRFGLPMRLLGFFEERAKTCGDDLAAAFLSRRVSAMRRAREPGGEGEPSLAQLRKAVERSHPLGRPSRDILRHVKPLERAQPDRAFRALSPRAASDVGAVRANPSRYSYPQELIDAVVAASTAGRHEREIAAHFAVPVTTVGIWVREKPTLSRRRAGMNTRSHQDALVSHARRHPEKTTTEVGTWLNERHGVVSRNAYLQAAARKRGVRMAHTRRPWKSGRSPARIETYMRKHPQADALDVQAWAKTELDHEIDVGALCRFARSRGLRLSARTSGAIAPRATVLAATAGGRNHPKIDGAQADKLDAWVRANSDADIHEVTAWVERELGIAVVEVTVRKFLKARGLKIRRLEPGRKVPYGPALLAWVAAHPDAGLPEALAWLDAELGCKMHPNTVWGFLDGRGIRLRRPKYANCTKIAGEHAAAIEAYVRANGEADIHDVRDWIKWELDTEVALGTLYRFLQARGLKTRKLPPGPRPSRDRMPVSPHA